MEIGGSDLFLVFLWSGEVAFIVLTLVFLLKMIVSHVTKINDLTKALYGYINRSQLLSEYLDREFELMNQCVEQVKTFTVGYSTFYKTLAESRNTVSHALCANRDTQVPVELKLSQLLIPARMDTVDEPVPTGKDGSLGIAKNASSFPKSARSLQFIAREEPRGALL
ncbi:UNVERIFIED_CONTAM: hypothetical protein PYX00_008688 [Menopon gallinae]|uniref:ATP synthase F0 subunit 8 n=1 Tax=Menopon gallinae TaxID=328185 RepID=A0AAW2HPX3_9NEOP